MGVNPFTGKSSIDETNNASSRTPIVKYILIVAVIASLGGIAYYFRNNIITGIVSANRDFTYAYLMGDPWNGKIVYMDVTSTEPSKQIFSIYNTKTQVRKEFATYRIGTDPFFQFLFIGENQVTLHDYISYGVSFDFDKIQNTSNKILNKPLIQENSNEENAAREDTMSVIPQKSTPDENKKELKLTSKKNYFYFISGDPTDIGTGIGKEGNEEQEINATELREMGVYNFKNYGLKYSYWVYDCYARQEIIDSNSGGNLILIELASNNGSRNTKSFFVLVDKKSKKVIKNGYPANAINCPGYLHDYFINCRRDGADHILCLTRDKVLRVQISTCKIKEITNW